MNTVTHVEAKPASQLLLTFADGLQAVVDIAPLLNKGIALELAAPEVFSEVVLEPGGGIAWPNGFDLCPEFLRELAEKRQEAA